MTDGGESGFQQRGQKLWKADKHGKGRRRTQGSRRGKQVQNDRLALRTDQEKTVLSNGAGLRLQTAYPWSK